MKVIIQKADLDTCLTGLILGVAFEDEVVPVRGNADSADLKSPLVLCIEAGGSGLVEQNNFDHHNTDGYLPPACRQAFDHTGKKDGHLARLVEYVCRVDEGIPIEPAIPFPSLSNLFSGLLFVEKTPVAQFRAGLALLNTVLKESLYPFYTIPDRPQWRTYIRAKLENQKKLEEVVSCAEYFTSKSGLRIGFSEHDAIGGLGALYQQGCRVGILHSPRFGDPPVRKFTIGSDNVDLTRLKASLEAVEPGWGGTLTILGSPRAHGTALSKEEVISFVKENV